MADNVPLPPLAGTIATSQTTINGTAVHVQRVSTGAGPAGAYGALAPTTSAVNVAANNERKSLLIRNAGSVRVYFGSDTSITSSNAPFLEPGETLATTTYIGAMHFKTASGTGDIRYWEET